MTKSGADRVLFDECVPRKLLREIPSLAASHAIIEGWAGYRNGTWMRAMLAAGFGTLVTVDRNLAFQQNIAASGIAVIVLHARSNRVPDLTPLIPALLEQIASVRVGEVAHLGV